VPANGCQNDGKPKVPIGGRKWKGVLIGSLVITSVPTLGFDSGWYRCLSFLEESCDEKGGSLSWILAIFGSIRIGLLLAVIESSARQKQELPEVKSGTTRMNIM